MVEFEISLGRLLGDIGRESSGLMAKQGVAAGAPGSSPA
jgi:hypothetical protein